MTIRFRCPHCKKPLGVKDHLAGKKASCPACKKGLTIPASAPSTKTPAAKPDQPPVPAELPAADVDELAAAAFTDEPDANGKQVEPPALIDFKCEFCEGDVHAPIAEAGKRMQCPNPECRRLIKVPTPKGEKPKDWRELAKKGPTVAQMMQEEKIDEAAWGTQTDKVRAGSAALKDAGALPAPKAEPIGMRGWMRRITRVTVALVVLVLVVLIASRIRSVTDDKGFVGQMKKYVEPGSDLAKDPVVRAEVYRAIAEYKIRKHKKHFEAIGPLKQALASLSQPGAKGRPIEHDLFLIELALTMSELGGTEDEQIAKEKFNWSGDVLATELRQILGAIKAPEARVMAMRALATRLLEENQLPLATGLASQMSNPEGGRRPPVTSQLVVLLLVQEKSVTSLVTPPSPKEVPEPLARVGFAEFNARTGNTAAAQELAFAKGPPLEQLEACVGVAQVLLGSKKPNRDGAVLFGDRAIEIVNDHLAKKVKVPPWLLLQTIRVVAQVKGSAAVPPEMLKGLPPEFRPRGYLELVLAEAAVANAGPLGTNLLEAIKGANPDSSSLDFGWEALARQNARVGKGDVHDEAHIDPNNQRFRPMADAGKALGHLDGR